MGHLKHQKGKTRKISVHGNVTLLDMQARASSMLGILGERPDLKLVLRLFEHSQKQVVSRNALVVASQGNRLLLNALTTTGFVTGQPGGKFFELTPIANFLFQQHGWDILK